MSGGKESGEVGELLGACDWCGGGGVRAQVSLEVAFLCNY